MEYSKEMMERIANVSFTLLYNILAKDKDPIEVFPVVENVIKELNDFSDFKKEIHPQLVKYSDALKEVQPDGVIRESLQLIFNSDFTPDNLIRVIACGILHYAKIGTDFQETIKEVTEYDNAYLIKSIRNELINIRDKKL